MWVKGPEYWPAGVQGTPLHRCNRAATPRSAPLSPGVYSPKQFPRRLRGAHPEPIAVLAPWIRQIISELIYSLLDQHSGLLTGPYVLVTPPVGSTVRTGWL